ncbi:hypothetical protein C8R45DRAFT_1068916 [Mycena sanguinolenta]|nr:hypothetical protein C8R45DRAFT_1068916 [Mycena sanguinolenta]
MFLSYARSVMCNYGATTKNYGVRRELRNFGQTTEHYVDGTLHYDHYSNYRYYRQLRRGSSCALTARPPRPHVSVVVSVLEVKTREAVVHAQCIDVKLRSAFPPVRVKMGRGRGWDEWDDTPPPRSRTRASLTNMDCSAPALFIIRHLRLQYRRKIPFAAPPTAARRSTSHSNDHEESGIHQCCVRAQEHRHEQEHGHKRQDDLISAVEDDGSGRVHATERRLYDTQVESCSAFSRPRKKGCGWGGVDGARKRTPRPCRSSRSLATNHRPLSAPCLRAVHTRSWRSLRHPQPPRPSTITPEAFPEFTAAAVSASALARTASGSILSPDCASLGTAPLLACSRSRRRGHGNTAS